MIEEPSPERPPRPAVRTLKQRIRDIPLLGGLLAWLNSVRSLAATRQQVAQLTARETELAVRQDELAARLTVFSGELDRMRALAAEHLVLVSRHLAMHDTGLTEHGRRLVELDDRLSQALSQGLSEVLAQLNRDRTAFTADLDRVRGLSIEHLTMISQHLGAHDSGLGEHGRLLVALDERLNADIRALDGQRMELAAVARALDAQRDEVLLLRHRLDGQEPAMPGPLKAAKGATEGDDSGVLDAYYTSFENTFRGSQEVIKQRLAVYLPHVHALVPGPLLDLGCGRGEWLEMLDAAGRTAYGIDRNPLNVARCRTNGLTVREEDALAHLRGLADGSLAAVTAFHLIEHLPFAMLIALVDEAHRVLASGGMILFETPNPENLQVGACTFYTDPTHLHPIPPAVTRHLLESRGFSGLDILRLHPYPETEQVADTSPLGTRFNHLLYGPQDYAVLGWKR